MELSQLLVISLLILTSYKELIKIFICCDQAYDCLSECNIHVALWLGYSVQLRGFLQHYVTLILLRCIKLFFFLLAAISPVSHRTPPKPRLVAALLIDWLVFLPVCLYVCRCLVHVLYVCLPIRQRHCQVNKMKIVTPLPQILCFLYFQKSH